MSQVGAGTTANLPNYFGELFTADMVNAPLITMLGGLNTVRETANREFPTAVNYDFPTAAQPGISEAASKTAPTAISHVRAPVKNTTQIFQEQVDISYVKQSNGGALAGLNTAGSANNVPDEFDWQIQQALRRIARDAEMTALFGVYAEATDAATASTSRGIRVASSLSGGVVIDAGGAKLNKALIQLLFRTMSNGGADFVNAMLLTDAYNRQGVGDIYGYAPENTNVGGVNINVINDSAVGQVGVMQPHRFMAGLGEILCIHPQYMGVVGQPVPGKGNFFYEDLAKVGAAEQGQIFGQLGIDHGPAFMVGRIHNLATS